MNLRMIKAGGLTSILAFLLGSIFMLGATAVSAEGQWWSSEPAVEDAKTRLYRVKGIRSVFFHRDSAGYYEPHLVVDKMEFSLAQQKAACEIIWRKYGISTFYEYQGHMEEDQLVHPLNCDKEYPELAPNA